jgi:tetratricopeptide (TPR) repeat protein
MATSNPHEPEPIGVSAGSGAPTSNMHLPPEHATAMDKFYEARSLRRRGASPDAQKALHEARELLKRALAMSADPDVRAALAETAIVCALEEGDYRGAAILARSAFAYARISNAAGLDAELKWLAARSWILQALDRAWTVDWPSLDDDDQRDLIIRRHDLTVEVVFDETLTTSHDAAPTDGGLRLTVNPEQRACELAAHWLSEWIALRASSRRSVVHIDVSALEQAAA